MAIKTLKGLLTELDNHADSGKLELSLKIGSASYTLKGALGVTSASHAFVKGNDDFAVLFGLDSKSKTASVIQTALPAEVGEIAAALLPKPEPPKEALDALSALPKLPAGWVYGIVNGKLTVVEGTGTGAATTPGKRTRRSAAEVAAAKAANPPKPELGVGMIVTRKKDGFNYKITKIEPKGKGKMLSFAPVSDGEKGLTCPAPVPFWTHWSLAQ